MTGRKLSLFAATAMVAMVASFGAQAKEAKKIGLAVANLQANFFNQIKESVEAEGAAKGVKIITVDAKGDAATQVNQIQDLIAQNIDLHSCRRHRRCGSGQGGSCSANSGREYRS
jgi:ribose transport system substrate-binding protein